MANQLSPLSDQQSGEPILKKAEDEYKLDPVDPDVFEHAETQRILDIVVQKLQVKEVAGELIVKVERGVGLPEVDGKPNFSLKFKWTKYNLAQLAKQPNANIHTIFKDDKIE